MFHQLAQSFFWQPGAVVPSLADLPLSGRVLAKNDVSLSVRGEDSTQHPLLVVELAGGKIIGDLRLAATADDVVIGGMQAIFGSDDPAGHYALRRRRFRIPKRRRGTALLLGASASDNYYHWMLDSLPRWKMLQQANHQQFDYVLLQGRPSRFQDETLDWLGVPAAKRLRCSKNFVHQFERLVVATMPAPQWVIERWTCQWLRSLFPGQVAGSKRIYLSRHSSRRRLVNELELEAQLGRLGFTSVKAECLPVAQQAKLFSEAEFVVAPHGAGLTNMVFAPPGTRLLELFHPQHRNTCYSNLAATCGHHYQSLEGCPTNRAGNRHLEFSIDAAEVARTIREKM